MVHKIVLFSVELYLKL